MSRQEEVHWMETIQCVQSEKDGASHRLPFKAQREASLRVGVREGRDSHHERNGGRRLMGLFRK